MENMEIKVRQLIKQAMLDKNENAKLTYRSILANALKTAKDATREITDDDIIKATKNEIKQLTELHEYVKNDEIKSADFIEKIKYCEDILPQMVTTDQIIEYITHNNIEKNIGVCMKSLKTKFGSTLDGKMANGVVRQYINS